MTTLIIVLVLTVIISAVSRAAGASRKIAVIFATIPMAIAQLLTLSASVIVRTVDGSVIPRYAQFVGGILLAAILAVIVAAIVKRRRPIQPSEPTRGVGP